MEIDWDPPLLNGKDVFFTQESWDRYSLQTPLQSQVKKEKVSPEKEEKITKGLKKGDGIAVKTQMEIDKEECQDASQKSHIQKSATNNQLPYEPGPYIEENVESTTRPSGEEVSKKAEKLGKGFAGNFKSKETPSRSLVDYSEEATFNPKYPDVNKKTEPNAEELASLRAMKIAQELANLTNSEASGSTEELTRTVKTDVFEEADVIDNEQKVTVGSGSQDAYLRAKKIAHKLANFTNSEASGSTEELTRTVKTDVFEEADVIDNEQKETVGSGSQDAFLRAKKIAHKLANLTNSEASGSTDESARTVKTDVLEEAGVIDTERKVTGGPGTEDAYLRAKKIAQEWANLTNSKASGSTEELARTAQTNVFEEADNEQKVTVRSGSEDAYLRAKKIAQEWANLTNSRASGSTEHPEEESWEDSHHGSRKIEGGSTESANTTAKARAEPRKQQPHNQMSPKKFKSNNRFSKQKYLQIPLPRQSWFSQKQQGQYLELYQKFQHYTPQKNSSDAKEFNHFRELQVRVQQEQKEFLEHLEYVASQSAEDYKYLHPTASTYAEEYLREQRQRIANYKRYYVNHDAASLAFIGKPPDIPFRLLQTLLKTGPLQKCILVLPRVDWQLPLSLDYTKISRRYPIVAPNASDPGKWNKPVISEDPNIEKLVEKYPAHIVCSGSVLACLIDNVPPQYNKQWEIPITVKEIQIERCGKQVTQKVAYMDKPFVPKTLNGRDKSAIYHKRALKTLLLHPDFRSESLHILMDRASTSKDPLEPEVNPEMPKERETDLESPDMFESLCDVDIETFGVEDKIISQKGGGGGKKEDEGSPVPQSDNKEEAVDDLKKASEVKHNPEVEDGEDKSKENEGETPDQSCASTEKKICDNANAASASKKQSPHDLKPDRQGEGQGAVSSFSEESDCEDGRLMIDTEDEVKQSGEEKSPLKMLRSRSISKSPPGKVLPFSQPKEDEAASLKSQDMVTPTFKSPGDICLSSKFQESSSMVTKSDSLVASTSESQKVQAVDSNSQDAVVSSSKSQEILTKSQCMVAPTSKSQLNSQETDTKPQDTKMGTSDTTPQDTKMDSLKSLIQSVAAPNSGNPGTVTPMSIPHEMLHSKTTSESAQRSQEVVASSEEAQESKTSCEERETIAEKGKEDEKEKTSDQKAAKREYENEAGVAKETTLCSSTARRRNMSQPPQVAPPVANVETRKRRSTDTEVGGNKRAKEGDPPGTPDLQPLKGQGQGQSLNKVRLPVEERKNDEKDVSANSGVDRKSHGSLPLRTGEESSKCPSARESKMAEGECPKGSSKSKAHTDSSASKTSEGASFSLDDILSQQEAMLQEGHSRSQEGLRSEQTPQTEPAPSKPQEGAPQSGLENPDDYLQAQDSHVTYNHWLLGQMALLVRNNVHGTVSMKSKKKFDVHIVPKMEYQPCYGFEQVLPEESARHWINSYLRPGCKLVRGRVNAFTSDVMMVERLALQEILNPSCVFSPASSVVSLHQVLTKVCELTPGSYLLSHTPGKGHVGIKRAVKRKSGAYDLHAVYSGAGHNPPQSIPWVPLDPSLQLPDYQTRNRIPMTFNPFNPKKFHPRPSGSSSGFQGKKKKKKKSKKKGQMPQMRQPKGKH